MNFEKRIKVVKVPFCKNSVETNEKGQKKLKYGKYRYLCIYKRQRRYRQK